MYGLHTRDRHRNQAVSALSTLNGIPVSAVHWWLFCLYNNACWCRLMLKYLFLLQFPVVYSSLGVLLGFLSGSQVCQLSRAYLSCKGHVILKIGHKLHIHAPLEVVIDPLEVELVTFVCWNKKLRKHLYNALPEGQSRRTDISHTYEGCLCLINFNFKCPSQGKPYLVSFRGFHAPIGIQQILKEEFGHLIERFTML